MLKIRIKGQLERQNKLRMVVSVVKPDKAESFRVLGLNAYALLFALLFVLSDYNVYNSDVYSGSQKSFYFEFDGDEDLLNTIKGIANAKVELKNSMLFWSSELSLTKLRYLHSKLLTHFLNKYGAVIL